MARQLCSKGTYTNFGRKYPPSSSAAALALSAALYRQPGFPVGLRAWQICTCAAIQAQGTLGYDCDTFRSHAAVFRPRPRPHKSIVCWLAVPRPLSATDHCHDFRVLKRNAQTLQPLLLACWRFTSLSLPILMVT